MFRRKIDHKFTNKNCWSSHQDQKNIQTGKCPEQKVLPPKVLTAKRPDREIFDRQIPDRQISDRQIPNRQISDRPLSPTEGVNPTWVSPLSWDRRLSCYQTLHGYPNAIYENLGTSVHADLMVWGEINLLNKGGLKMNLAFLISFMTFHFYLNLAFHTNIFTIRIVIVIYFKFF